MIIEPAASIPAFSPVDPDQAWFQPDEATKLQARQVARKLDCDEIIASRLVMRGMDAQQVAQYLSPSPQEIVHPRDTADDMMDAATALLAGIRAGDPVSVYGDYDVDGQTSMAILCGALERFGATVHSGQANAATGFGLSRAFVESAAQAGSKWLVTVDCGSTQTEPVRLAQSLGMRVIVIDHHDVDIDNPTDFHVNPRLAAAQAARTISRAVTASDCRQRIAALPPYDEVVDRLTERSTDILIEWFGASEFESLVATVRENADPTNTGSVLTWKFVAAMYLACDGSVPSEFYGEPLYLAGLGAIADLAPCDDPEIRAFVRCSVDQQLQRSVFGNRRSVPIGVEMLAQELGEDASRPDTLIRTRALCNLPKRTTEIDPADIQLIFRSGDRGMLQTLIPRLVADYERLSSVRRDQMDVIALEQVAEQAAREQAAVAGGEADGSTRFAFAVLDGFEPFAGYTRMVANTLAKHTGKPAIAFACKGTDDWGQTLYKWSAANGVVPEAKLGELISDQAMREACAVIMRDWLGNEALIENIGGHTEVASGVCTRENIEAVKAAAEAWAEVKDRKREWRPIGDRKRPRVTGRNVSAKRFRRLEREAPMLAPFSFPESPAPQVSVQVSFSNLSHDDATGRMCGLMTFEDGMQRPVCLSEAAQAAVSEHPDRTWEAIVALGGVGDFYVGHVTFDPADAAILSGDLQLVA
jgi:single-stranded DNA-specific DHH superfamily exonuclease